MASPKYKLIYFDIRGKGERLRWMFAYAKVSFEDYRIKELPYYFSSDPKPEWDVTRQKMPFGAVPVLEVDGQYLGETHAIGRFLAKQFGLYGADDWEGAQIDSIMTYIASDFEVPCMAYLREIDPAKKRLLHPGLFDRAAHVAKVLERILQKNQESNSDSRFFVGNAPTVADFFVVGFYDWVELFVMPGFMSQYDDHHKVLTAHRNTMRDLPGVKEFIQAHAHLPP